MQYLWIQKIKLARNVKGHVTYRHYVIQSVESGRAGLEILAPWHELWDHRRVTDFSKTQFPHLPSEGLDSAKLLCCNM